MLSYNLVELTDAISNLRKNFLAKGISLNFRALTFSLNMKNPPYHIESVTCEDQVRCTVLSQVFLLRQNAIFLKSVEVDQISVQAETLYSNKLASVTRRFVPSRKLSRREIRNCPTISELNYLFVLVRFSNSTRKVTCLIRSESVRSY